MTREIVVVGGGLAGISAALLAADRGYSVTLIESKRFLGGRVGSFYDRESLQWVDFCQHVGMDCCEHLRWLIDRLGQQEDWERQKVLHFFTSTGKHIQAKAWPLPAPLHLAGLLLQWPELTLQERMRIGTTMLAMKRLLPSSLSASATGWEDQHVVEWLRSSGQSENALIKFWGTILTSALGEKLERINLGAAHKVMVDGFMATRSAYQLLVPRRPLSELIGQGALQALVQAGVHVQLSKSVSEILLDGDKAKGVALQDGTKILARDLVIAVPWFSVKRLFESQDEITTELWGSTGPKLESAPITGVHTWWDRNWLETPHAILIDRFCHWVFPGPSEDTNANSDRGRGGGYYQVVISGSRELPKGEAALVEQRVVEDLQEVFPECRSSRLLKSRIVTDPNAVFSVAPGHGKSRLRTDVLSSRRIWFAGDWIETGWPATMESAVRSAHQAIDSIAES